MSMNGPFRYGFARWSAPAVPSGVLSVMKRTSSGSSPRAVLSASGCAVTRYMLGTPCSRRCSMLCWTSVFPSTVLSTSASCSLFAPHSMSACCGSPWSSPFRMSSSTA